MTKGTPANISQLVKDANNKSSWKIRLAALNELKQYDCQQSRDVITRLALHDKVYKVKEEAFRAAQAMGITYRGNPIRLGRKDIGFKTKDFTKVFLRMLKRFVSSTVSLIMLIPPYRDFLFLPPPFSGRSLPCLL